MEVTKETVETMRKQWNTEAPYPPRSEMTKAICDAALKYLEIQEAFRKEYSLRDSIKAEMAAKGAEGILWTNGQCKDWPAYVRAIAAREQAVEAIVTSP
jgi:hypothetical protein